MRGRIGVENDRVELQGRIGGEGGEGRIGGWSWRVELGGIIGVGNGRVELEVYSGG